MISTVAQSSGSGKSAPLSDLDERLGAEIRARLSNLVESAERALGRARVLQASGEEAVRGEVTKIDSLRERVEAVAPCCRRASATPLPRLISRHRA
jgi:hypothetical protein